MNVGVGSMNAATITGAAAIANRDKVEEKGARLVPGPFFAC
jgi:hypothetical protein